MKIKNLFNMAAIMTLLLFTACGSASSNDETEAAPESPASSEDSVTNETRETTETATMQPEKPKTLLPHEKARIEAESLIARYMKVNVTYKPLSDPDNEYNLHSVKNIHIVSMLTGEYSINQTKSRYGVGGTDLGVMFRYRDKMYIAFGDTFLNEPQSDSWRCNVLACTTDFDYTDGILFDGMIADRDGNAKEFIRKGSAGVTEITKIPTGAVVINDTAYVSFMSVRHWGDNGQWDCNYGGIAYNIKDDLSSWTVSGLKWPGDSSFCQMAPVLVGDMVYVPGITGGRLGQAKLMRVPAEEYLNMDAYEYFMGFDAAGNPIYEKGEDAVYRATTILSAPVGESCFMYSEYLEEWIVVYLRYSDIILRSAKNIEGPYSRPVTIAAASDFPALYGGFMHPQYVSEDGKKIAWVMSLWTPIYNSMVMEMELERK